MSKWKTVRLGDVCEKGASNITQNEIVDNFGEYPIYGAAGFIKNVDFYKQEEAYIGIVKDGAGVGRISIHPAKSSLIGTMQYIFPNENIDIKFLASFLKYQNLGRFYTGATIPHIYFKDYKNIKLKLPPLETQKQIAAVLDKCTSLISKYKKILEKYDTLIKSRFIEMFDKIINESTKIPLEDICDFVTVGIANSATHAFCDNGVIMFRNQNIKEDFLDDSDIIHIKKDFADKYKTKALKENDLLIVRTGYPGICCLVPQKYEGCQTFTTLIARLKKNENINPKFICHYINSDYGREYVNKNQAGVAQQNFGATALSKMPMCIPSIELQNNFATFVQQIDKSKFEIEKIVKMGYN